MHKHHKTAPIVMPPAPRGVARAAPAVKQPAEEEIRKCAYRKWEMAGRPEGDGVRFWIEAEKELAAR
jgi:hypothetical protein